MPWMAVKKVALLIFAVLAAGGCQQRKNPVPDVAKAPSSQTPRPAAGVEADPYGLRPAEKSAVEAFLKTNTDLRMAVDSDARAPDASLTHLYGVYHPFFVRGDLSDDGLLDFVLAFVRRDSPAGSPWFSVVVFVGREGGGFEKGTFLERDITLADGDLSIDRDSVLITPDTSDDPNRRYRWDAVHRQFKFVSDAEEPADTPPVART